MGGDVIVLRQVIGDELRRRRQDQGRTLRDVSGAAAVSLGYLSEIERGQKEASSELLAALCGALEVSLSDVLASVSTHVAEAESEGPSFTGMRILDSQVGHQTAGALQG